MLVRTEDIIAEAREWIGTPYHHQASLKGVGCDCIGLVRGVFRGVYGYDVAEKIDYSRDWGDSNGNEDLVQAANRHMEPLPVDQAMAGNMVVIRWKRGRVAKHAMILTENNKAIHAYNNSPVAEIHLNDWWRRHILFAFKFPKGGKV